MIGEFKKILAVLSIVALLLTCFVSFSFADRGEREDSYKRSRHSDSSTRSDRHSRSSHDDRATNTSDEDDDDDDDAGTTPAPTPAPSNQCSQCHSDPGTTTLPRGHINIGGTPAPVPDPTPAPVPDPTPAPVPDPTPAPVPDPIPAPVPTLDGQVLYNQNCSGCHGSSKRGSSASSTQSAINSNRGGMGSISLTPAELDAISKY